MYLQPKSKDLLLPRLTWKIAAVIVAVYYLVVMVGAVAIYHNRAHNSFTNNVASIFPYPAATVSQQMIPLATFNRRVAALQSNADLHKLPNNRSDIERLVMGQLVNTVLYEQELAKHHISISQSDIQNSLQKIYDQNGGQAKLTAFLDQDYGGYMDLNDFKVLLEESLAQSAIQQQVLTRVTIRHILIALPNNPSAAQIADGKGRAQAVRTKITDPSQFADVAKQYSEDVASRDNGGQLGSTGRGDDSPVFSTDFENLIFTIPVGQVSDPVLSPKGWHLVIVDKRTGSVDKSLKQFTADLLKANPARRLFGA